jgi:hypothetical protein
MHMYTFGDYVYKQVTVNTPNMSQNDANSIGP